MNEETIDLLEEMMLEHGDYVREYVGANCMATTEELGIKKITVSADCIEKLFLFLVEEKNKKVQITEDEAKERLLKMQDDDLKRWLAIGTDLTPFDLEYGNYTYWGIINYKAEQAKREALLQEQTSKKLFD